MESHHKRSSLYDTFVPYNYRKGYTWAGTTASELMAIWQGLPYIKHNSGQIKEHCHERPAPAAPAPGLLVSIFHMSRGKIKKALPSDSEESLSKYYNNCFAQNSGQSNCRSTWKAKEKTMDMAHTIRNFSFLFLFYGPRPNLYYIDPAGFFYLGIHFPLFQIAILGTRLSKNVPSKIFDAI